MFSGLILYAETHLKLVFICNFHYNKSRKSERQAVPMTTQFKNVNGHIEVYDSTGEFLFSADTMEEAWRELCA